MSARKSKTNDNYSKSVKKAVQARPSLTTNYQTPVISSLASPIRLIKTMKSQSNLCYPSSNYIKSPKASLQSPKCKISIKSIEKKVDLLKNDDNELSPIHSCRGKGFFSMTEEELNEFKLFLKELKK